MKPFAKVDVPRVRFMAEAVRLVNSCSVELRPLLRRVTDRRPLRRVGTVTVKDFDAKQAQVYIPPSKSGKPRYVPLNASGAELFTGLTTGREAKDPMFVRSDGEAWDKNH